MSKVLRATHRGVLPLGGLNIPCAVLEDGTRVLSQGGFLQAIGRSRTPKGKTGSSVAEIPTFLAPINLKPFIDDELILSTKPIKYQIAKTTYLGYRAECLPKVCEIYLRARDARALLDSQKGIAVKADIVVRALAHVGIIALVDEATGYQEVRDREALQQILDAYISKELAAWAKRFPDEFYREMFRLKGWQWKGMKVNRPSVVGHYTNDIVYDRLAPGVLAELRKLNPPDEKGQRKDRHHQWLTTDLGHPKLAQHLSGLIALMKASTSWSRFTRLVRRAYPKSGEQQEIDID